MLPLLLMDFATVRKSWFRTVRHAALPHTFVLLEVRLAHLASSHDSGSASLNPMPVSLSAFFVAMSRLSGSSCG